MIALVAGSIPVAVSIWLAIRHLPRPPRARRPSRRHPRPRADENDAIKALGAFTSAETGRRGANG